MSVNGISMENVTHAQAVETLKTAGRSVLLVCAIAICVVLVASSWFVLLLSVWSWYVGIIYKWLNLGFHYISVLNLQNFVK